MAILKLKIKASTLLEVVMASSILVSILFIGLLIFSSIYHSRFEKLKDQQAIDYAQSLFNAKIKDAEYYEKYLEYDIYIERLNTKKIMCEYNIIIIQKEDTIWNAKRTLLNHEKN